MSDGVVIRLARRHLVAAISVFVLVLAIGLAIHDQRVHAATLTAARVEAERSAEVRRLESIEREAQALARQNAESERSIERIERTLGAHGHGAPAPRSARLHAALTRPSDRAAALAARLSALARAAARTQAHARRLASLATHVLNLRRLASIARARTLAAIPSLTPVDGEISASFGWRTNPWPEFHKGLDLAADYGTPVRAAASGTVATAGWVGGYGNRVDIDHGNGYHTWYCHLSRIMVTAGQHVERGDRIAAVGSTGESTGPHLHYEVLRAGVAIDPQPFLHGVPANLTASLPDDSDVH
jgi:murein DD-endopeptidase MepM/ murein hydrolase activator NlpD